ncbi:MAG: hypothetical protein ACHQC8_01945 [Solirubrobacterales bacterium]
MTRTAVRNRAFLLTLVLLAAATPLLALRIAPVASADATATPTVQSASDPPPSKSPGYWAQTSCSEGDEIAGSEGWRPESAGYYPTMYGHIDTCLAIGGSLGLLDEGARDARADSGPLWVYEAPPISTIAGGVLKIQVSTPKGEAYVSTPDNSLEPSSVLLDCTTQCASGKEETVAISHTGGWELFAGALCLPPSGESVCSTGLNAELEITSATIMLHNTSTPAGTGFGGTLLNDPTSGKASLAFTAQDKNGPGVYRVSAQVDGQVMWSATPNLNKGECVAYGSYYGALNFRYRQPCPQETAASIEIPTSAVADGQHQLKVEVEDAAGHTAVVYEHTITTENHLVSAETPVTPPVPQAAPGRGACNGSPCDEAAKLIGGARQPLSFTTTLGKSSVVLAGLLDDHTGTPIRDAQVQLLQQVQGSGSAPTKLTSATTRPDGTWTLRAPAGPSRLLRVAYYSHLLDTTPAATLDFHQRVKANVSLRAPRRVRVGQTFDFAGRLAGGYVPPSGEPMQMEIFFDGRWRTIEVLSTTSSGRWSYKYSFTVEGGSYKFRAVPVPNGSYPFASTPSRSVRVTVRR